MNTPRNNFDHQPDREASEPRPDPRLDALLDEAFSAKHVAMPKGMNDRILAAMAQAQGSTSSDTDGNEGHVLASIGIVRWVWIGLAAAAVFAVSAFLLLQGTGPTVGDNGLAAGNVNATDGHAIVDIAILQGQIKNFDTLGNMQRDPLDRDLAALDSKINELNNTWASDRSAMSGSDKF